MARSPAVEVGTVWGKQITQVHRVTGVREGHSADVRRRHRRYAVSMGIRTLSFVAAVLLHGPLRWVLLAVALLLPYVAVVVANGGRRQGSTDLAPVVLPSRTQLRAGTIPPVPME